MTVPAANQKKSIVLADDFIDADDAGVSLAEAGWVVDAFFQKPSLSKVQAIVFNSDRSLPACFAVIRIVCYIPAMTVATGNISRCCVNSAAAAVSNGVKKSVFCRGNVSIWRCASRRQKRCISQVKISRAPLQRHLAQRDSEFGAGLRPCFQ